MGRNPRRTVITGLITVLAIGTSLASQAANRIEFFSYDDDDGESRVENDDPCSYDSRRDVGASNLDKCLEKVKRSALDTALYWFGERWKTMCALPKSNAASQIACYNPHKLQRYESLGARLLRVSTFDLAYLRNLVIFPQMTFVSSPGQYMACDHLFRSDVRQEISASPSMEAAPPWHLRKQPFIRWSSEAKGSRRSASEEGNYIILIVDVGLGDLYYLAYNYPVNTVNVKPYTGPLNFRDSNNPVALLVFRQTSSMRSLDWQSALEDGSSFNVQKFMIKNNLTQNWIGLNWINVGTDGYAIEEQRKTSFVDNCPLLIRNRLVSPLDGIRFKFLPTPSLATIDTWMSITFVSMPATFVICCKRYNFDSAEIKFDPLGDKELRPVYMRHAPNISVPRPPAIDSELYSYRRFSRDYMTVPDDGHYTLLMLDSDPAPFESSGSPLALWLVINIRGTNLQEFTETKAGMTILPYMAPSPADDRLHRYVFLLFRQQGPITRFDLQQYSSRNCKTKLIGRCSFNVQDLMARNGLTLRALNWILSRQDEYVRYNLVKQGQQDEKKLCHSTGRHYEEHCHPVAVRVVGANGRTVNSAPSTTRLRYFHFRVEFLSGFAMLRFENVILLAALCFSHFWWL